ncbi:MAG TPA: histidine kinase dimerization/phosphoacceptor domain -containing protein [Sphingomicrobium sp.]|jgi:two-component sensor histidine kinase|nr:histidine kinase dimerization/phosphoacceptor domain -containing protein [Sphingomicrobium sp.]
MTLAARFARLPTAAKLLLILTAVLLPIGAALTWLGESGIRQSNVALEGRAQDQSRAAAESIQGLIARNALALRIAANGALSQGPAGACERAQRALTIAPGVSQSFELETANGVPICSAGSVGDTGELPIAAPGDIKVKIAPNLNGIAIRVGVIDGMATAFVPVAELRSAAIGAPGDVGSVALHDEARELRVLDLTDPVETQRFSQWSIGTGALFARISARDERITPYDRLVLLLPVLMWVAAALLTWLLVSRLLIRPLKRLELAVIRYTPGSALDLPRKLGPSEEIQELRDAFARAVARVEASDSEMASALEGQRRLVREVHHRVKNNLQVVASLLNIHGRSATAPEARSAYAGISRRVGALSIVHRNHFAEMEENRGIAMRPLLTELAAELRGGAPDAARSLRIDLELDPLNTTQDVAVAVAFLVTEIVEFSMLHCPTDPIELSIRRTSELTARLTLNSRVLNPDDDASEQKLQFERIVAGLAKQLRSTLDRKLGRYSVDLPVFPPLQ